MRYMARQNKAQHENAVKLSETLDSLDGRFAETQEKLQRNYVTILGIFAAIVVGFTGGFSFSGSVLDSIGNADVYCLIFASSIGGMVVFDLVFAMYFFVCLVSGISEWRSMRVVAITVNVLLGLFFASAFVAKCWSLFG